MKKLEEQFYQGLLGEEKVAVAAPVEPPPPPAPAPRPLSSKSVFSHPDTHPVVLDLALIKQFQLEWMSWLPETLFHEIEKSFGGSIAEVNKLKILAVQTLHVVDSFWEEWEIFEKIIMALNGMPPRLETMQPPDLPLLYAGVEMALGVRKEEFNEEVSRYCAAVFLHENVHYAPKPLEFCQPYISQPTYCCKDCGKCGSALPPFDGLCSSCAGHFEDDKPLNFQPDPEALKKSHGQNITLGVVYEQAPVRKRFEELSALPSDRLVSSIRETAEDIQAAKLIIATDFMNFRSQQLKDQLGALRGWLEMA